MEEFYDQYDDREFTCEELVLFHESFKKYRKTKGLKDFTDMLEAMATEDYFIPSLDVLIIDEAQDFSELQWRVAKRLIERANQVFVAGDDDQAIYTFAGASARPLVEMGNSKDWNSIVLNKSYRIPKSIQKVAFNTLNKIPETERIVKQWDPKADAGIIKNILSLRELPLHKGQWCFLARTSKILKKYARELRSMGFRYRLHDDDSVKSAHINAIKLYEKFRANSLIGISKLDELDDYITDFKLIRDSFKSDFAKVEQLPVKMYRAITDTPWYKIFNKGISREDIEYYRDILRNQDSLEEGKDRIFLKTMHSAKGLEWENVVVIYDISPATEATLLKFPGDEFRVLYVAETRAKQGLYRMFPQSNRHYPFDI
jgi:DNA helicase-2/ATP-dependent DNA helicase PcrA